MVLQDFIPKGKFPTVIVSTLERITQPVSDFVRGNPIVATAAIGAGFTGLTAAVATLVRKKKATTRRKTRKRVTKRKTARVSKRRKRATHRSPRHKGHKRVSFTTATGKRVKFLVRGQKRSPKHRSKHRRFVKGSKEAKAFMAKLRRMKR